MNDELRRHRREAYRVLAQRPSKRAHVVNANQLPDYSNDNNKYYNVRQPLFSNNNNNVNEDNNIFYNAIQPPLSMCQRFRKWYTSPPSEAFCKWYAAALKATNMPELSHIAPSPVLTPYIIDIEQDYAYVKQRILYIFQWFQQQGFTFDKQLKKIIYAVPRPTFDGLYGHDLLPRPLPWRKAVTSISNDYELQRRIATPGGRQVLLNFGYDLDQFVRVWELSGLVWTLAIRK
jgi:hypothetical protein